MTCILGQIVRSFFEDHLRVQKGLRPASIRSYRDAIRLFLIFVSREAQRPITKLDLRDLTFERALAFLKHLEEERRNHVRTRNQRLAALHMFVEYLAVRNPEMLETCQRVAAIPVKRVPPPATHFLERGEVGALLKSLPREGLMPFGTAHFFCSCTTRALACKRSPISGRRTWNWESSLVYSYTARGTSGGSALSGRRRYATCGAC